MSPQQQSQKDNDRQVLNFAHSQVLRAEAKIETLTAKSYRNRQGDSFARDPDMDEAHAELADAKAVFLELQATWIEKHGPEF